MRITTAREPPLLSPPSESHPSQWFKENSVDKTAFEMALRESREVVSGLVVAEIHHLLKDIGYPQKVEPEDMRKMKGTLAFERENNRSGSVIAAMHVHLRALGIVEELTAEDEEAMKKSFGDLRKGTEIMDVIGLASNMRLLGQHVELTPDETKAMRTTLERTTSGYFKAKLHTQLAVLGLDYRPPKAEVDLMRVALDEYREYHERESIQLVQMHYWLRRVFAGEELERKNPQIPPLKRFQK